MKPLIQLKHYAFVIGVLILLHSSSSYATATKTDPYAVVDYVQIANFKQFATTAVLHSPECKQKFIAYKPAATIRIYQPVEGTFKIIRNQDARLYRGVCSVLTIQPHSENYFTIEKYDTEQTMWFTFWAWQQERHVYQIPFQLKPGQRSFCIINNDKPYCDTVPLDRVLPEIQDNSAVELWKIRP